MPGRHTLRTATKPLAALLLPLALMAGCYGGRTTIPSEPQRITEAEGRKARQQREGVEKAPAAKAVAIAEQAAPAQAAAPAAAPQPAPVVLKVETKPAPEAAKAETATTAITAMEPAQPAAVEATKPAAVEAQAVQPAPAKVVVKAVPAKQAQPLKQAEPAQTEAAASADQAFAKVAVTAPKETAPKEAAAKVAAQQAPVTKTVTVTMADAKPTEQAKPMEQAKQPEQAKQAAHPLYVQMGSFTAEKNAEGAVAWLKANGYEASRVVRAEHEGTTLYRVQAGPYQDPAAAHKVLDELKVHWPQAFIPAD